MKFYPYSNRNNNYTKAISLENISSLELCGGSGKSVTRFSVQVNYANGREEFFFHLYSDEAEKLYKTILDLLNK